MSAKEETGAGAGADRSDEDEDEDEDDEDVDEDEDEEEDGKVNQLFAQRVQLYATGEEYFEHVALALLQARSFIMIR
jgi:hypothetical protein